MWNSTFKSNGRCLKRTGFALKARKPMSRGTSQLKRASKPMRSRRLGKPQRPDKHLADMCHGQDCYAQIQDLCRNNRETVVPMHSNQLKHGKGKGIKAPDKMTCPGCDLCHHEIDQGNRFTKEEKFAIWDAAYAKWLPVRARLLEQHK
jgi:predicted Fe-S protein YdhL (DUF1289 family)